MNIKVLKTTMKGIDSMRVTSEPSEPSEPPKDSDVCIKIPGKLFYTLQCEALRIDSTPADVIQSLINTELQHRERFW